MDQEEGRAYVMAILENKRQRFQRRLPITVHTSSHKGRNELVWSFRPPGPDMTNIGRAVPGAGLSEEVDALLPADACPCEGADLALSACAEVLLAVPST